MTPLKKNGYILLSFIITIVILCVVNYVFQIAVIFLDIISRRLNSSAAYVIVLWLVTGVFTTVFTEGVAEQLAGKEHSSYKNVGTVVLITSCLALVFSISLLLAGEFRHDPEEFSLLLSNGYVFTAFFAGTAAMALVFRKLD
jgi:hypothetical protein